MYRTSANDYIADARSSAAAGNISMALYYERRADEHADNAGISRPVLTKAGIRVMFTIAAERDPRTTIPDISQVSLDAVDLLLTCILPLEDRGSPCSIYIENFQKSFE